MTGADRSSGDSSGPWPQAASASPAPRIHAALNTDPSLVNGERASGDGLLSRGRVPRVSSALAPFTTVFGMGTGGPTPLESPETLSPRGFAHARKGVEAEIVSLRLSARDIALAGNARGVL